MKFLIAALIILFQVSVWAADRAANIQGRLSSSLGNILPTSDFLVIVNRLDQLEDGGQAEVVLGTARPLPGLTLSVDSKGNIVRQDMGASNYNGPVSISLLIDRNVRSETYELIRKEIADLAGGLRDLDEFRINRGVLRQAPIPNPNQSSITINQPKSDDTAKAWTDTLKLMALFVILGGLFLWMSSRRQDTKPSTAGTANSMGNLGEKMAAEHRDSSGDVEKVGFKDIPAEVVSLFLLRAIKDRQTDKLQIWLNTSTPSEQRSILMTLPSWVSVGFEKVIQQMIDSDVKRRILGEEVPAELAVTREKVVSLYREMSVLERNLREKVDYQKSFLMWFPPHFVREVGHSYKTRLSENSKRLLWSMRPDLGEMVRMDADLNSDIHKLITDGEVTACYEELCSWKSSVFAENNLSKDAVQIWSHIINELSEFGAIKSQLSQAQGQLSAEQYALLERRTVGIKSPLVWGDEMRRKWLLEVSPEDYVYWTSLVDATPSWNLDSELRPLRRAMFRTATQAELHKSWDESAKKAAALRLLSQFRKIQLGTENAAIDAA